MPQSETQYPEVHMACRRGNDKATHGQVCDSKRALNKTAQGAKHASFECTKCHFQWTVPVGGTFHGV
jgi:transposase-like protein